MQACRSVERVLKADTCSGCGACASLAAKAITMQMTEEGFLRPKQIADVTPQTDATIASVCPGLIVDQTNKEGHDHVLWGPIVESRIGFSTDDNLRHHASSGGGISALLIHLLKTKQVDRVLHIHASDISPVDNVTTLSVNSDGVADGAGSRYAPSAPLEKLEEQLNAPGRIALVGKPCDIAAARAMAARDPRIDQKVPFMLSFFCAGVPSRKGTLRILEKLGTKESDVTSFRYRGDGWPGFATAVLKDGTSKRMSYMDSWGAILSHYVQPRCKICVDGTGAHADVVCADAWDCDENGYPTLEERDGQSMIISRTAKGERLVREAMDARVVEAKPLDVNTIKNMQPGQFRRKRLVLSRIMAMRVAFARPPVYKGFQMRKASRLATTSENAKSFLGMLRRLLIVQRRPPA
jgi:coenzyme F420 hydrogenase subunit beta